ncbi:MAG TPA: hypothetical protein PK691_01365, partial [Thermomicrobiales bacterium]|nr:hypothetical protein [Thermomicrobiales bacterium]
MRISTILRKLVLLVLGAIWILPLYLFLINASTAPKEFGRKERWQLPQSFALFDNVSKAWEAAHLADAVLSTAFYAIVGGLLACLLSGLAAYA